MFEFSYFTTILHQLFLRQSLADDLFDTTHHHVNDRSDLVRGDVVCGCKHDMVSLGALDICPTAHAHHHKSGLEAPLLHHKREPLPSQVERTRIKLDSPKKAGTADFGHVVPRKCSVGLQLFLQERAEQVALRRAVLQQLLGDDDTLNSEGGRRTERVRLVRVAVLPHAGTLAQHACDPRRDEHAADRRVSPAKALRDGLDVRRDAVGNALPRVERAHAWIMSVSGGTGGWEAGGTHDPFRT
ncbi:unnamed protein product [Mycena citricolor]|uniref:Uncharacterized protein n=1 Tax=Mycena citricolor TaxID=2018698 RepID=A0AAD2K5N1_9AGAR|nr:unnamed protein product [Mycena citricolor]